MDWAQMDLAQLELRVFANAVDTDMHIARAALEYNVPPDKVTPEMRRVAKLLNFAVLYGKTG